MKFVRSIKMRNGSAPYQVLPFKSVMHTGLYELDACVEISILDTRIFCVLHMHYVRLASCMCKTPTFRYHAKLRNVEGGVLRTLWPELGRHSDTPSPAQSTPESALRLCRLVHRHLPIAFSSDEKMSAGDFPCCW